MNVFALDLSLTATGVAYPAGDTLTIAPKTTGMQRLAEIRDWLLPRLDLYDVDLVVLEGYAFGRPNQAVHLGELGGVIRLALWERGVVVAECPPASLKKYATGRGNASKDEVMAEAIRRLRYAGNSKDEADALWLRAAALDFYGEPVVRMPEANRDALRKVAWPSLGLAA